MNFAELNKFRELSFVTNQYQILVMKIPKPCLRLTIFTVF